MAVGKIFCQRVKRLQAVFRHPDLLFACWRQRFNGRGLIAGGIRAFALASAGSGIAFIYLGI